MHSFRLPEEAARGLEAVGRQYGATLFMVLLTAYQVLLSRHTGQDDILVGTPVAGRDRVEFEPVVGYFTRTLVLRAEVAADLPFDELLLRTRRAVLDALDHQDVPFEDLLAALGVERDPSPHAAVPDDGDLAQPGRGRGRRHLRRPRLRRSSTPDSGRRSSTSCWRPGATRTGSPSLLDYDAELFDASTVATLAQRFVVLLGAIVAATEPPGRGPADPHRRRSAIPRRARARRRRSGPAGSRADRPRRRSGTGRGRRQLRRRAAHLRAAARARPAALAGRLAGHDVVGVCLDRSTDMVVALLAAWSAGAAYLPLDPEYPGRAPRIHDRGQRRVHSRHRTLVTTPPQRPRLNSPTTTAASAPASRGPRPSTLPPTSSTPQARPASRRAWRSRTPTWPPGCAGWRTRTNSAPTTGSCSSPR